MNLLECAFGVTSGKFLGFVVCHEGIEVDPAKMKTIIDRPPPTNILKEFQDRIDYLRLFMANLFGRCDQILELMKKDSPLEWDEDFQKVFDNIKAYLSMPPS